MQIPRLKTATHLQTRIDATIKLRRMFLSPLIASRCSFTLGTLLTCLTLLFTGCGYHQAGSATHIPAIVRTLAIPIFATNVQAYHTEMAFTQATIRELNIRTKYQIIPKESADADATLHGTILTQTVAPLTYDANTGQTSSYLVTITAKVILTAHDGTVLYRNESILYREQYQSTEDLSGFIQEDGAAVKRVARDFAQAIVSDMLESF
jgi:outer membrane lipopolysaccharide assembly protein LptE/RlpB